VDLSTRARLYRQIGLIVVAAAVLLGVNVPPAYSFIQEQRHLALINSPEYMSQYGHWDVIDIPPDQRVNSIHAALLSTGKVLMVAGSGNKEDMFATKALKSLLYDPKTGQSRMIPVPDDMFCGGQTMLPDGRMLFAGGTQRYERLDGAVTTAAGAMTVKNEDPNVPRTVPAGTEFVSPTGAKLRSDFDVTIPPAKKTLTNDRRGATVTSSEQTVFVESEVQGPAGIINDPAKYQVAGLAPADAKNLYGLGRKFDLSKQDYQGTKKAYTFDPVSESWSPVPDMNAARWYPTLLPLADGTVLTLSGLDNTGQITNRAEVFDPKTQTWADRQDLTRLFSTYPAVLQTGVPNRLVFSGANAGYGPADQGRTPGFWDLTDNVFTPIPGLRDQDMIQTGGTAFIGPVQDQRLAVVGGGAIGESPRSTGRIDFLDLNSPTPAFRPGPTMPEGVRYPNLVNLPDDSTLISNGSQDYRGKGATNNHLAEFLRPDGTLTPAADPAVGRDYHSEGLLLPDGRVLTAGSDPLFDDVKNTVSGTFEQRIEIYSPPYMYQGNRPTITDAPTTMPMGSTAHVTTPDASRIRSARLMKASTATHVTTVDMRSVALDVRPSSDGVDVTVPPQPEIVTPGPYMLFLVDDRGVPTEAKMVTVPTKAPSSTQRSTRASAR
jgi:hypothetical protein